MKIQGKMIIARFQDGMSFEDVNLFVQQKFPSLKVHCQDCLSVLRNFREACRGYWVGIGLFRHPNGSIMGRAAINAIEYDRNDIGVKYEISFDYRDEKSVAEYSRLGFVIRSIHTDDWNTYLVEYLKQATCFKKVEVIKMIYDGEPNLFYSDLERRLEEGDFEGGEDRSRYVIPTNICSL
jgi:hypothetical protein